MEDAAASFSTVMLSISWELMENRSPSIPSTRISIPPEEPSPIVPWPRRFMEGLRPYSCPLRCLMFRPGTWPWRARTVLPTGTFSSCLDSTTLTEPVRLIFFCVAKPTTTVSSSISISSVITTTATLSCPTMRVWDTNPMLLKVSRAPSGAWME